MKSDESTIAKANAALVAAEAEFDVAMSACRADPSEATQRRVQLARARIDQAVKHLVTVNRLFGGSQKDR